MNKQVSCMIPVFDTAVCDIKKIKPRVCTYLNRPRNVNTIDTSKNWGAVRRAGACGTCLPPPQPVILLTDYPTLASTQCGRRIYPPSPWSKA